MFQKPTSAYKKLLLLNLQSCADIMKAFTSSCSKLVNRNISTWQSVTGISLSKIITTANCIHTMISVSHHTDPFKKGLINSPFRKKTVCLTTFMKMPKFSYVKHSSLTLSRSCERNAEPNKLSNSRQKHEYSANESVVYPRQALSNKLFFP